VRKLGKGRDEWLTGIIEFSLDPMKNSLAYIQRDSIGDRVMVKDLNSKNRALKVPLKSVAPCSVLEWDRSGGSFVFLQAMDSMYDGKVDHKIFQYTLNQESAGLKQWSPEGGGDSFEGIRISNFRIQSRGKGQAVLLDVINQQQENDDTRPKSSKEVRECNSLDT